MDGQATHLMSALDSTTTMHFTFMPVSVIAQISLSQDWEWSADPEAWGQPAGTPAVASALWEHYVTKDGHTTFMYDEDPVFGANGVTEAVARLEARNSSAHAFVNFFFWPNVGGNVMSGYWYGGAEREMEHHPIPNLHRARVVVLYDPPIGRVAHKHIVNEFAGGRAVPEEEAVQAAQHHAVRLRHRVQDLQMKVASNPERALRSNRIDPKTGEFIPAYQSGVR